MSAERKQYSWIGDDHPPRWRRVGQIDVADPADTRRAIDQGQRIGTIYDGGTHSVAEPCAADVYERPAKAMAVDQKCLDLAKYFLGDVHGHTETQAADLAAAIQLAVEDHLPDIEDADADVAAADGGAMTLRLLFLLALLIADRADAAEPADTGPRWQLWQQSPGQEWRPRGKALRASTACDLDLVSVAVVVEKATKLACRKVGP